MNSNLCNYEDFLTNDYEKFCELIHEKKRIHRKQWEFYVIYENIKKHVKSFDGKKGLGFAVGSEVIVPLFVKLGANVTASDLDPNDPSSVAWANTNQHMSNGFNKYFDGYIKKMLFENKCEFKYINMNNIPLDLNGYDFIWSSCALEHLGSIKLGLEFIEKSLACLKPGGVAVHTTEFNYLSNDDTLETPGCVCFRKKDIEQIVTKLSHKGYSVEIINYDRHKNIVNDHVDEFPYNGSQHAIFFEIQNYDVMKSHINIKLDKYVSTSIYLVIKKPLNLKK